MTEPERAARIDHYRVTLVYLQTEVAKLKAELGGMAELTEISLELTDRLEIALQDTEDLDWLEQVHRGILSRYDEATDKITYAVLDVRPIWRDTPREAIRAARPTLDKLIHL